jgi:hypothetical protein
MVDGQSECRRRAPAGAEINASVHILGPKRRLGKAGSDLDVEFNKWCHPPHIVHRGLNERHVMSAHRTGLHHSDVYRESHVINNPPEARNTREQLHNPPGPNEKKKASVLLYQE